ncbi:hypothetical protein HU200_015998 [Digitaria exilis]|uniref:Uncharacterized protein n=1 Tax=Digitaria exilis TaxID=1010633 RepID=A0A835KKA3_9POAL|nr:hypothetical protein HU200_015998 [Digitaria exilis]
MFGVSFLAGVRNGSDGEDAIAVRHGDGPSVTALMLSLFLAVLGAVREAKMKAAVTPVSTEYARPVADLLALHGRPPPELGNLLIVDWPRGLWVGPASVRRVCEPSFSSPSGMAMGRMPSCCHSRRWSDSCRSLRFL